MGLTRCATQRSPGTDPLDCTPAGLGALPSEAVAESLALRAAILEEIDAEGRIPFRRFMQRALYDEHEGYYRTREAAGRRGDYLTSPELHPLFGALLGRQVAELWQVLDRPERLRVVEMGAGSGSLARGLLAFAGGGALAAAVRYTIVEPIPLLRDRQQMTLGAFGHQVRWAGSPGELSDERDIPSVYVSNELVDAFPVHRVTVRGGRLLEIYVGAEGGVLREVVDMPSTPAIARYFERLGVLPGEGCAAEVNLDAPAWIREVAATFCRGFVLTLDYGYPAEQLYAPWRRDGTLLCFHGHTVSTDPYRRIGRQDLTAHVDFTSLKQAGREVGLETLGFTTQREFLAALGIADALAGGPSGPLGLEEYLSRRRAVDALLNAEGLGRVRVLLQGKAVGRPHLRAFAAPSPETPRPAVSGFPPVPGATK